MPDYTIVFTRSARKELESLLSSVAEKITSEIEQLRREARPSGTRKLQGADDLWRLRVGDYRVVYAIDDKKQLIDVRVVRHRKDAYR